MQGLLKLIAGLEVPAAAIFLVVAWGIYRLATAEPPPPPTPAQTAQVERDRIVREALALSTPAPPPKPTATPLPEGWPKRIVQRTWSSVGNINEPPRYEAWSVPQVENYRRFAGSDASASETVRALPGEFSTPDAIVKFAVQHGIVVSGYTTKQGSAVVPQRR